MLKLYHPSFFCKFYHLSFQLLCILPLRRTFFTKLCDIVRLYTKLGDLKNYLLKIDNFDL